jgi:putative ABC transport system ATP-binding protein
MMLDAPVAEHGQRQTRGSILTASGVSKSYATPAGQFTALADIDLVLERGSFLAVVGKSGSGKSTLINLLTGIDRPTAGTISVAGEAVTGRSESQLAAWRGRNVGIVFQFFQLLPTLTIAENVMLPMDLARTVPAGRRRQRATELLDRVGIADQAGKFPAMLSGGQQQRAAIARALANDPPLLVADEPTGNLDSKTTFEVMELLCRLNDERGITILMVTHEDEVAHYAKRIVHVRDGLIGSDVANTSRPVRAPKP